MFETTSTESAKKSSFTESLASIPKAIDSRLPTMDKQLDKYFDANISSIISEWGLVTRYDLDDLEHRLDMVTNEISTLEKWRAKLQDRARDLESAISDLEASK
jgi:predicted  nucleic acid-binding Zn-ribbon protein